MSCKLEKRLQKPFIIILLAAALLLIPALMSGRTARADTSASDGQEFVFSEGAGFQEDGQTGEIALRMIFSGTAAGKTVTLTADGGDATVTAVMPLYAGIGTNVNIGSNSDKAAVTFKKGTTEETYSLPVAKMNGGLLMFAVQYNTWMDDLGVFVTAYRIRLNSEQAVLGSSSALWQYLAAGGNYKHAVTVSGETETETLIQQIGAKRYYTVAELAAPEYPKDDDVNYSNLMISWQPHSDTKVGGYIIRRKMNGELTEITSRNRYMNSYLDTQLPQGTPISYEIYAVDDTAYALPRVVAHYEPLEVRTRQGNPTALIVTIIVAVVLCAAFVTLYVFRYRIFNGGRKIKDTKNDIGGSNEKKQ